jgi:hypothetical protein
LRDYEDAPPRAELTLLNVPLTLVLSELITVIHATTIKASITAYSTAVGPSSLTKKRRIFAKGPLILDPLYDRNLLIE